MHQTGIENKRNASKSIHKTQLYIASKRHQNTIEYNRITVVSRKYRNKNLINAIKLKSIESYRISIEVTLNLASKTTYS